MSHVDEGTLHALLDGELDSNELHAVEEHLRECEQCSHLAEEARYYQDEADLIVDAFEAPRAAALPHSGDVGGPTPEPIVLMPLPPETPRATYEFSRGRRPRLGGALWAASIAIVLGGGYLLTRAGGGAAPSTEPQSRAETAPAATVAPEELAGRPLPPPLEFDTARPDSAATLAFGPGESLPAAQADTAADAADSAAPIPELGDPTEEAARELAALEAEEESANRAAGRNRNAADREAADREPAAREPAAAVVAEPPPPAPRRLPEPSLQQRVGVYMRIGLDEASRMLGGEPLHVIAGLGRPEFVGLADGIAIPGASPRPVVRVVYLDESDRPVMLDQQRLELEEVSNGSKRDTSRVATEDRPRATWIDGDVWLSLHGEIPASRVNELVGRVR